jgi:hypothetical protein
MRWSAFAAPVIDQPLWLRNRFMDVKIESARAAAAANLPEHCGQGVMA